MKAVAYNVLASEKEYFAKANKKKHDITLIANPLGMDTVHYAEWKEAIIMPEGYINSKRLLISYAVWGLNILLPAPPAILYYRFAGNSGTNDHRA